MSPKNRQALKTLSRNYRKNKPIIEKKLRKAGVKPDAALVFVAAQYFDCLNRLAKE